MHEGCPPTAEKSTSRHENPYQLFIGPDIAERIGHRPMSAAREQNRFDGAAAEWALLGSLDSRDWESLDQTIDREPTHLSKPDHPSETLSCRGRPRIRMRMQVVRVTAAIRATGTQMARMKVVSNSPFANCLQPEKLIVAP